jgi:UDP-N-acetylglucosamine 2-epimerase (non-hydrolysing)
MVMVGTRPEIVKMAPVIKILEKDSRFQLILVDSGQHYDPELSANFYDVLQLPPPQHSFGVGSGTQAAQTGKIMMAAEKLFTKTNPDIILAQGDTNTVMAASLAAVKNKIPFGHVEAGLRSFDRSMPEEINRIIADHCSDLHFAPTTIAAANLLFEGCSPSSVHITGNTVVDTVVQYTEIIQKRSKIIERLKLRKGSFAVVTIHRPATVDTKTTLSSVISAFLNLTEIELVFPIHPRTRKALKRFGLQEKLESAPHIILTEPLDFLDFINLMSESRLVLTDSGGLQEEAFTLGKPCITLRTNTERPESVQLGGNFLVGRSTDRIIEVTRRILADSTLLDRISRLPNPFGDGRASERIIEGIAGFCQEGRAFIEPQFLRTGTRNRRLLRVEDKLHERTILEIERMLGGEVLLVYDKEGHPAFPEAKYTLTCDEHILVDFGDQPQDN